MKEILAAAARLESAMEKLDIFIRRPAPNSAPFDVNRLLENLARGLGLNHAVEPTLDLDPHAAVVHGDAENLEKMREIISLAKKNLK